MQPRTKKLLIIGCIITTLAIVGIVTGVVVSEQKKKDQNSTGSSSSSNNGGSSSGGPRGTSTSNAPSPSSTATPEIELNPALHKSFWGMAYTPYGAIMPDCGANLPNVTADMRILTQLTTRLRLYGSDCNVTSLVLQAIEDLQIDMDVYAGIYLELEEESYTRQKQVLEDTLATYGTDHVLGVAVGNEYVLVQMQDGLDMAEATTRVVEKMTEVRDDLTALGYDLPVGTSDAGGMVGQAMVDGADFVFANIHPWFSSNTAESAAQWANDVFDATMLPLAAASPRNTVMFQGEMGWPTASDDPTTAVNGAGSAAGVPELQTVLDTWVCSSNEAGTRYFWFSAFDEAWKAEHGGVEPYWGLFDINGELKVTIPDCPPP